MSSLLESHDSLPYIDTEPTEADREKAQTLINANLPIGYSKSLHPSLSPPPKLNLTPLMEKEVNRKAKDPSSKLEGGIDLSRYEAPDTPSDDGEVDEWRKTLRNAYTSTLYLSNRHKNLALLEEYGKNAWLIGNSRLESTLQDLERRLESIRSETDEVNKSRKGAQEKSRGEIVGLEEAWRKGVGRMIEVQVAKEGLRQEILERRRAGAG